tara:strand:- start:134 stop:436 length:303 start_codon:yes stop_codon:yes gene_type:complete
MEALFYTGFGLALFCLGVATGAIIENRLIRVRSQVEDDYDEIYKEVKEIKPMLVSLVDKLERDYNSYTPVIYELQDPNVTMELPIIKEESWLRKQKNLED